MGIKRDHKHAKLLLPKMLLLAPLLLLAACGGKTDLAPGQEILSGKAAKGPMVNAAIEIFEVGSNGLPFGPALYATTTDAQGEWTLTVTPGADVRLIKVSGGTFIDESDTRLSKRTVTLGPADSLYGLMPPGATEATVSVLTDTLVRAWQESLQYSNDTKLAYSYIRDRAVETFGFNPFLVIPSDPLQPNSTDSESQKQYGMLIGGIANLLNNAAINAKRPYMDYSIIDALSNDYADCVLDSSHFGTSFTVDVLGVPTALLVDNLLENEIIRFRNNNFQSYSGVTPPSVLVSALCYKGAYAANDDISVPQDSIVPINVIANDFDPDNSSLTVTLVTGTSEQGGVLVENGDGTVTYTPPTSYVGTDRFDYTVSDGTNPPHAESTKTVNIVVTPLSGNNAPNAVNDGVTTNEDVLIEFSVTANDIDADANTITVDSFDGSGITGGVLLQLDNTTFRFTPDANWNGNTSFTYVATDGAATSNTATVNITVLPVNDVPVSVNDSPVVNEDAFVDIVVVSNDTDIDGDTLSIFSIDTSGTTGTVVQQDSTTIRYQGTADFNGGTTFTYTVTDGVEVSFPATVNVTVTPVNDAPVATNDAGVTDKNILVTLANVKDNDTDIDGDALTVSAFDSVSVNGGSISQPGINGVFDYTPPTDFVGLDSFDYTLSDGSLTAIATVMVTVNDVIPVDTDGDGLTDSVETGLGTSITNPDTDGDGFTDYHENQVGTDPLLAGSVPAGLTIIDNTGSPYIVSTVEAWTLAGSPYVVLDSVSIQAGGTLSIEPGVVVKFDAGKVLEVNGGTLNFSAGSTLYTRVTMTSLKDDTWQGDTNADATATTPGKGDWQGILHTTGTTSIDGVNVHYATEGVSVLDGTPSFTNIAFRNSLDYAIEVWGSSAGSNMNPSFVNVDSDGVQTFSTVYAGGQGSVGISLTGKGKLINNPIAGFAAIDIRDATTATIDGYEIVNGRNGGIQIQGSSSGSIRNCIIRQSETLGGIDVSSTGDWTIEHNVIVDGAFGGINVYNNGINTTISHNLIRSNYEGGVYIGSTAFILLANNLIVQNEAASYAGGVSVISSTDVSLLGNTIAENAKLAGPEGGVAKIAGGSPNYVLAMQHNIIWGNVQDDAGVITAEKDLLLDPAKVTDDYNLTSVTGMASLNGLNTVTSDPLFAQEWYLQIGSPAIDATITPSLPTYLTAFTSPSTRLDGGADVVADNMDIGYHHDGAIRQVDAGNSVVNYTAATSVSTPVSIFITPKDADGKIIGPGLDVRVTEDVNDFGTLSRVVRDIGTGEYEYIFTSSATPGQSNNLTVTVNGTIVDSGVLISW